MNPDYDKASAGVNDGWSALIIFSLLFSVAIHVGLMIKLSDCPFAPLPVPIKNDRRWTKEDPLAVDISAELPPPAPPDAEKPEDRVDRLADATAQTIVPDMPAPVADAAPKTEARPEPAQIAPTEWQPRQEILAIEMPTVPDEAAALPRLVIPKAPRVAHASDVVPAFDLLSEAGAGAGGGSASSAPLLSGKGLGGGGRSMGADLARLAPMPPPIGGAGTGGTGGSSVSGLGGPPPLLTVAREPDTKKQVKAEKKDRPAVAAPPPPLQGKRH